MSLKWEKIKEEKYRAGYRKMFKKTFKLPNGKIREYDTRDDGRTVCVLALTPENKAVMEKVFRPGPEKILTEMPGGIVEENEEPTDAIKRELLEETGYSGDFEFVAKTTDDAYSNCERYCYVARNCRKVSEPAPEDDEEDVEIVLMELKDFRKHLKSDEISDVECGFLALDHLNLL